MMSDLVQSIRAVADNVLAQKLALEHAEDHLLEKANTWDLVGGRRAR